MTCEFWLVPLRFVPHLHHVLDVSHALAVVRVLALVVQGSVVGSPQCVT